MFTGIIEDVAQVYDVEIKDLGARLIITSKFINLLVGESISVNGVCLTVLPEFHLGRLQFDLSPETLERTNLGKLEKGDVVNLERAMLASARFGGHYVSGHVDTICHIQDLQQLDAYLQITLSGFDKSSFRYLLPKGSITVDGVSLTINKVCDPLISLMLIPHTLKHTTFQHLQIGQQLNVEFDYFARIVAHQLITSGQLQGEV